jgi:hypothetical protein
MVTLKEVFATIKLAEEQYKKSPELCGTVIDREIKLRTKLARAIARDNPPLDPNHEEDLNLGIVALPKSTILSDFAKAIFKKYCAHLFKKFHINPGPYLSFKDIRNVFQDIRSQKINIGMERSWRPKELSAFNRLCTRIANDSDMSASEVMLEFEEDNHPQLFINEASIELALSLFKALKA